MAVNLLVNNYITKKGETISGDAILEENQVGMEIDSSGVVSVVGIGDGTTTWTELNKLYWATIPSGKSNSITAEVAEKWYNALSTTSINNSKLITLPDFGYAYTTTSALDEENFANIAEDSLAGPVVNYDSTERETSISYPTSNATPDPTANFQFTDDSISQEDLLLEKIKLTNKDGVYKEYIIRDPVVSEKELNELGRLGEASTATIPEQDWNIVPKMTTDNTQTNGNAICLTNDGKWVAISDLSSTTTIYASNIHVTPYASSSSTTTVQSATQTLYEAKDAFSASITKLNTYVGIDSSSSSTVSSTILQKVSTLETNIGASTESAGTSTVFGRIKALEGKEAPTLLDYTASGISDTHFPILAFKITTGTSSSITTTANYYDDSIYIKNDVLYGACWNDYAELREIKSELDIPAGTCVVENGDDTLSISSERLQLGGNIISDTCGMVIGLTSPKAKPVAVSGRVLAQLYENRTQAHPGMPVCTGPHGTVSLMSDEELRLYPNAVIGTISAVPTYEYWGTNNILVNNRVWIKVR